MSSLLFTCWSIRCFFFFNDTATTQIYTYLHTLSLHDALPISEFLLPDEQGRLVRLNDLLGEGPVAIVFNRGQWCPYCRINVDALARAEEDRKSTRLNSSH